LPRAAARWGAAPCRASRTDADGGHHQEPAQSPAGGGASTVCWGVPMAGEVVAVLASGLFAGAAVYINLVEHPARVQCGTELAITQFGPSYHRATLLQVPLASTGFAAGAGAWISGGGLGWLVGGVVLGSVMPFTVLVIFPTNKKLLDPALDRKSHLASDLLDRWARLHAVRSVLSVGAFVLFVSLIRFRV